MKLPTPLSLMLLLLALAGLAAPLTASPLTLYVSPSGHDSASGRLNDPLATPGGARDRLRALKRAGKVPHEGATVLMLPGTYRLKSTFTLSAADDLSPAPVTYEALVASPKGTVHLTGGQEVRGWKTVTDT